jgi:hypothetical protein
LIVIEELFSHFFFKLSECIINIIKNRARNLKRRLQLNPIYKKIVKYYSGKYQDAQATVRKHPVSIALSNRILQKIDQEATKQKRSRSEYIELHFETLLSTHSELEN